MDSSYNRQIEMMAREGVDPVVLREVTLRLQGRRTRWGFVAVAVMMLGLGAISLATPTHDASLQAAAVTPQGMQTP